MVARACGLHGIGGALLRVVLIFAIAYLGLGLGFHILWRGALAHCRQAREARGEFVDPEVFWEPLALAFNVTFWPVYAAANIYHDGTPFATPCTHQQPIRPGGQSKEDSGKDLAGLSSTASPGTFA